MRIVMICLIVKEPPEDAKEGGDSSNCKQKTRASNVDKFFGVQKQVTTKDQLYRYDKVS